MRRRVASLTFELAPRGATVVTERASEPSVPTAGAAFAYGIFPGGGQYYTHRPFAGFLITAATAGALFYGLQQKQTVTTETRTATDPNGQPYQYAVPVTHTLRPNAAAGIGAAAAITLIAAIEASSHARAARRVSSAARALIVAPTRQGIAVGARLAVSP